MKSKEQEKSDFWECCVGISIFFILGAIGGGITMIFGLPSEMGVSMGFLILGISIILCGIAVWIEGKLHKTNDNHTKNYGYNNLPKVSVNNYSYNNIPDKSVIWMRCPSCGRQGNFVDKKCPYCSFRFKNNTKPSSKKNKKRPPKKHNKKNPPKKPNKKEQSTQNMIKNIFGTIKCPKCNKEIIATSVRCKYCKYEFKTSNNKKSNNKKSNNKKSNNKKSNNKKEIKRKTYKKEISAYERLKKKYGTKKCPNCNKEVISTAEVCKYCKYSFNKNSNKKMYEYKKCPFCENIILKSDRKCKHCKRAL